VGVTDYEDFPSMPVVSSSGLYQPAQSAFQRHKVSQLTFVCVDFVDEWMEICGRGGAEQLEGGVEAVDPWDFFLWPQYNSVEESLGN
jgi:hypothetical protein